MSIHPTAIIGPNVTIDTDVTIGAFSIVDGTTYLGEGTEIGSHCLLGHGHGGNIDVPLVIGAQSVIRSHAVIYAGSTLGPRLQTGHHTTIRAGTRVGTGVRIGTYADVEGDCDIADHVSLHSKTFVPPGTTIGPFAWLFPGVIITNDPHPPSDDIVGATIGAYAAIGAASVILPGITIGADALVAAGSVVTRDVPAGDAVKGSPAKRWALASEITLASGAPAYPWRDHFQRGYPAGALHPRGGTDTPPQM